MDARSEPTIDESRATLPQERVTGDYNPGTVLAGRYRIVSLLGRGGMGEVYRADDLILGQSVALKFLPDRLADANHLARFRQEVALARRVSHPHVCRVYDICEHQGRTFLSMEFIDGENLASLLLRVGRLTEEKALEIARQLCGALAALHDQGLLHRDLKPANVMLDGRGAVRLADFGLMAFAESVTDIRSGTWKYQAPEQLTGKEVTRQSDLFALGLVLFEVFTGKRPFPADSLAELKKLYQDGSPSKPSSHVAGLNPAIERILLQCLEIDPNARPRSVNEILAALPGDLLAAAVAAGKVPSPDLVANATADGELSLRAGLLALGGLVIALALVLFLTPYGTLLGRYPPTREPVVLRERAREILARVGSLGSASDWADGFAFDDFVLARVARNNPSADDWLVLGRTLPPPVVYWYRESPRPLLVLRVPSSGQNEGLVTADEPALEPGSARVRLDRFGRLVGVERSLVGVIQVEGDIDWGGLFRDAGLKPADFRAVIEPVTTALLPADQYYAWVGTDSAGKPQRVEAAAYRGHPVYFAVLEPVEAERGGAKSARQVQETFERWLQGLFVALLGLATVLAWYHCQAGLADVSGALRLGLITLALSVVSLVRYHHVLSLYESDLILCGLNKAVFTAVIVAVLYLGVEPFVRRNRPRALISWTRLLAARFRDPLVGRDIFLGVLGGAVISVLALLSRALPVWVGGPAPVPIGQEFGTMGTPLAVLSGGREAVGSVLRMPPVAMAEALYFGLMFLVLLECLLRSRLAAAIAWWAVFTAMFALQAGTPLAWMFAGMEILVALLLLTRSGLLAYAAHRLTIHLLQFPLTADLSAWYVGSGMLALATILSLAGYGFWISSRQRA